MTELLDMGVKQVWVVDPQGRDVSIYRPSGDPSILMADQELTGSEILPGFRCLVSDLYSTRP